MRVFGYRLAQGVCLLLMFLSASIFMLTWGRLDSTTGAIFGAAPGAFLMGGIGLLFAFVFERSRTPRATARYMVTRLAVVLMLAAGAAYVADGIWFSPERDELDAALEGASCGKYTGRIEKGWEQFCAEPRQQQAR